MSDTALTLLGRAEEVDFPELDLQAIPARVDTGAKTSSLWASQLKEAEGVLQYCLFDASSPHFNGKVLTTSDYKLLLVSNSTGNVQQRYVVRHLVQLGGRKVRASFTLADRSTQAYPILVGRNVLRGKFIVDVKQGKPNLALEKRKEQAKTQMYGGAA